MQKRENPAQLAILAVICLAASALFGLATSLPLRGIERLSISCLAAYLFALGTLSCVRILKRPQGTSVATLLIPSVGYGLALLIAIAGPVPVLELLMPRLDGAAPTLAVLIIMAAVGAILIVSRLVEKTFDDPIPDESETTR